MWYAIYAITGIRATAAIAAEITWAGVGCTVWSAPVWSTRAVSVRIEIRVLDADLAMAGLWSSASTFTTWATWSEPDTTVLGAPVGVTGTVSVHVACSVINTLHTVAGIGSGTSVTFRITSVWKSYLTLVSLVSIVASTCAVVVLGRMKNAGNAVTVSWADTASIAA